MTEAEELQTLATDLEGLIPPLFEAMEGLSYAGRYMHPPELPSVIDEVLPLREPLTAALEAFETTTWPEHLDEIRAALLATGEAATTGYERLANCLNEPEPIMAAYGALRYSTRAREALFPLASVLAPVSRFFVDDSHRDDAELLGRLAKADVARKNVGVLHAANAREERGGFSLYVPEYYEEEREWPVVVAMHGGSGHGRDFLWAWMRAARGHGVLLLSPTSINRTWSLMGRDVDSENLTRMIEQLRADYRVDESRIMLTGMSDGGTFALLCGLRNSVPSTHLAPISASFHPSMVAFGEDGRPAGLPIYLTHGALDWMFPIQVARAAREALEGAGALVEYREIEDLSHAYPREENGRILGWLLAEPA